MSAIVFPAIVPSKLQSISGFSFTSGTGSAFSAYTAAYASISFIANSLFVIGTALNGAASIAICNIQVSFGGAGTEIVQAQWRGQIPTTTIAESIPFEIEIPFVIPVSTRVAIRASSDQATGCTIHGFANLFGY